MRVRAMWIGCALLAGCHSFSAPEGADITRLSVPGGWEGDCQSNAVLVAPGEEHVVINTAGGRPGFPRVAVFDGELHLSGSREIWAGELAIAEDGKRILSVNSIGLECLSLPGLEPVSKYNPRTGRYDSDPVLLNVRRLIDRGDGKGWIAVNFSGRDGLIEFLDDGKLTPGRSARFGEGHLRSASMDRVTGQLVLLLDPNVLEMFDLSEMRTVSRTVLPCKEVRFDLPVAEGLAFISTKEGEVLVVDLAGPTVVSTVALRGQDASVALSDSGRRLVAATRVAASLASGHSRCTYEVTVFGRSGATLTREAQVRIELLGALNDLAILEKRGTVLLLGHETLAWRW